MKLSSRTINVFANQRCKGFTLLEVMVALLVVAIAITGLVKVAAKNVNNANYMHDKTFAQWVAVNKINEWRAQNIFPELTRITGQQMMGKQEWFWDAKGIETDDKNTRRVEIGVYKNEESRDKKEQPITRMISFLSKKI